MCSSKKLEKATFLSLLENTLSYQCSWHMCITKVDNSNEKYYLIIVIKLIYNVPDVGLTLTKKQKQKTISECNFANILKAKIFSGEQIFIAHGQFTFPSKLSQTEIYLY